MFARLGDLISNIGCHCNFENKQIHTQFVFKFNSVTTTVILRKPVRNIMRILRVSQDREDYIIDKKWVLKCPKMVFQGQDNISFYFMCDCQRNSKNNYAKISRENMEPLSRNGENYLKWPLHKAWQKIPQQWAMPL